MSKRKNYNIKEPRIKEFTDRFRAIVDEQGGITKVCEKTKISRPTINFWYNGERTPDAEKLITLSRAFGVSVDWLLGLTPNRTPKTTEQAICKYTGLSETSVSFLHKDKSRGATVNSSIVDFLMDDAQYADSNSRPITYLIQYFLSYDGHGQPTKQIGLDGQVKDYKRKDGFVSSNAILLNSQIIENAVLDEIKRALITLKEQTREEASKDGKH